MKEKLIQKTTQSHHGRSNRLRRFFVWKCTQFRFLIKTIYLSQTKTLQTHILTVKKQITREKIKFELETMHITPELGENSDGLMTITGDSSDLLLLFCFEFTFLQRIVPKSWQFG